VSLEKWRGVLKEKEQNAGETAGEVPLSPPQIPYRMALVHSRAFSVRGWRLSPATSHGWEAI